MLKKLNWPVTKIKAVHTRSSEVKRANSDVTKELKVKLLVMKGCCVMLISNL